MRVAINALAMRSLGHGVGNYIANLGLALSQAHPKDRFIFFINQGNKDLPQYLSGCENSSFEVVSLPRPLRLIWEQLVLPFRAKSYDVLHSPVYVAPLLKFTKYVLTELDMSVFIEPSKYTFIKRLYFQTLIPLSCQRADKILAISNSAAFDLRKILKVPAEKITVTPLGVRDSLTKIIDPGDLSEIRKKYHLPSKFILFLGVLEPRKNVAGLINAFVKVSSKSDLDLVIAGSKGFGWSDESVLELVKKHNLSSRVHFVGTVEERDKAALYSLATVFVYPSFYEGFGIPVLEAMACGTPVITSLGSSLEEISGNAAELIDPHNDAEIASAILKVSGNPKLQNDLSEHGLDNVRKFSWSRTAEITYETYKN